VKLTDYLVDALADAGVNTVFGVTGGSIVHPLHSAEKNKRLKVVYTHHEQAASFAADAVAHFPGQIGACFVTTGPGGTNAITGLTSSWLDSVPVIFVSGQARSEHLTGPNTVRQIGSQHIDIVSVVKSLTKFAKTIKTPLEARRIIEEAIHQCKFGRPGPVWIDIPLDLQWSNIDPVRQEPFLPESLIVENRDSDIETLCLDLAMAKRPIFICGFGIKASGFSNEFIDILERMQIPCVFTWNTLDILPHSSSLNLGLIGTAGSRDANLASYHSDLVIALGTHLSNQLIGNDQQEFAPNAKVYVVDVDASELKRLPARFHKINGDLKEIFPNLKIKLKTIESTKRWTPWRETCKEFKELRDFGVPLASNFHDNFVGQYYFYRKLSDRFKEGESLVIDGGGNALFSAFNSLQLKKGQHIISGAGIGCMGSGLPHAVGAAYAAPGSNVYCIIGDGSMQFNIQELATIQLSNLPIKIIIINNDGYKAIKDTQDSFFDCRFGVDLASGLSLPSYEKIAKAYDIAYRFIRTDKDVNGVLNEISQDLRPYICEVFVDPDTPLLPRAGYVKHSDNSVQRFPMQDMYPLLPRDLMEKFKQ
jgi:acetolactate synthase-1/2/3 large subunit